MEEHKQQHLKEHVHREEYGFLGGSEVKVHMVRSETKLVDRNEKETQVFKQGIPVHTWRNTSSSEGNRKENRIIHVAEKRQTKNG